MNIKNISKKIFLCFLCVSLCCSSVKIPVCATGAAVAGAVDQFLQGVVFQKIWDVGTDAVESGVSKVKNWLSTHKSYYNQRHGGGGHTDTERQRKYYDNNEALSSAMSNYYYNNVDNSSTNTSYNTQQFIDNSTSNQYTYTTFDNTVSDVRNYSLVKDSYNTINNTYETMIYNPITNNYTTVNNITYNNQYDTYNITNNEYNYYVTNNYTYVSYYIINNETNERTYAEVYFEMPDGRDSYFLEKEDVWGEYFIYDIANYELVAEDDGTTLALYHFDGNGKDSSYWVNDDSTLGSGSFASGKFEQGVVIGPNSSVEINLKNELDLKNFTLEMVLINQGDAISNAYFMIEDIVCIKNSSLINTGVNSLVFQGGNYDINTSTLPIKDFSTYFDTSGGYTTSTSFGFKQIVLSSDKTFYRNGGKISFTPGTSSGTLGLRYTQQYNGKSTYNSLTESYTYYFDVVSVEKYIPNLNASGIYIFKDSIVIKNTSSQSVVLDELRISNTNLYSSDTISVPSQAFDTNMVLTVPQNPKEDMIAIRGNYDVANCRIGGVRPTYPAKGDVYIYLEDDVVKDVQQYEGDAWYSVVGAIYQDEEWHDLKGFDMSTYTFEDVPDDSSGDDSGDDSGSNSGGTVSGNGTDDFWDGAGDFLDGIGKIFDTLLSIIGKIMGVVADFSQSVLDLFSGFTTFTDGFSSFLKNAFGFIPSEVLNALTLGVSLAVILAIVRFLRGK